MLSYNVAAILTTLETPGNEEVKLLVNGAISKAKKIEYVSTPGEVEEIVFHILAMVQKEHTFLAVLGSVANRLDLVDPVDVAYQFILLLAEDGLLDIEIGHMVTVHPIYDFAIPEEEKHIVMGETPKPLKDIADYEYGHVILGGFLKQDRYMENDEIRLDHLDSLNMIPLSLNMDLIKTFEAMPSEEQKGTPEWKVFKKNMYRHYLEIVANHDNEFHIIHKYDNRGRCYANSYYANYQGNDFQKAVIQLANKEMVM